MSRRESLSVDAVPGFQRFRSVPLDLLQVRSTFLVRPGTRECIVSTFLDALLGTSFDGGCDDCGARHQLAKDSSGIYVLTVEHDPTCPALAAIERRRSR